MGNACVIPLNAHNARSMEKKIQSEAMKAKHVVKVLLLGTGESGKSTVVKQMKIIHLNGFTDKEIDTFISSARGNIIESMMTLVQAMDQLGIIFENSISVKHSDRLSELSSIYKQKGKVSSLTELKTIIIQLWNDGGIQRCFCRRHEYQLIDAAEYFFSKVDEVMSDDYFPSTEDILKTRIVTSGVSEIHFTIGDLFITMIDVGGQRSERKKWLRCFDSVQAVIFIASLAEYDQVLAEDGVTNRMRESICLFGQMCEHTYLENTNMILFLNKKDLFADKLKTRPLTICFEDYSGPNRYREASMYVWERFEDVKGSKNLFSHVTCATDTENLKVVFVAVTDMLVRSVLGDIGVV